MEPSAEKLEALELLFKKYKSVLHPRHFVMITIKYALIELYGRVPGYEMDDLPDVLLERKENLCRDILKVSFCFIALKKNFSKVHSEHSLSKVYRKITGNLEIYKKNSQYLDFSVLSVREFYFFYKTNFYSVDGI